jgi:hypothetical protein
MLPQAARSFRFTPPSSRSEPLAAGPDGISVIPAALVGP